MRTRLWSDRLFSASGWVFAVSLAWIVPMLAIDRNWGYLALPALWGLSGLLVGVSLTLR
jgi:hypothetical protein